MANEAEKRSPQGGGGEGAIAIDGAGNVWASVGGGVGDVALVEGTRDCDCSELAVARTSLFLSVHRYACECDPKLLALEKKLADRRL